MNLFDGHVAFEPGSGSSDIVARLEKRMATSSYTDALVAAITANAEGQKTAFPTATAALEACAGFVGRAFAIAEIEGSERVKEVLTPDCMRMIGRTLMRKGEIVFAIRIGRNGLLLLPAQSHDVKGMSDPETWQYRVVASGPSKTTTYELPIDSVLHFTYATDPENPWRGYGPLQVAQLAGRLSSETVAALADESSGPRGQLLVTPVDGEDPTVQALKEDIGKLKGRAALVQGGDWDNAGGGRALNPWNNVRVGADPPAALVMTAELATREVYAACGLNPALFQSEGETATRESFRQALFSVVAPLGKLVEKELSNKLDEEVTITWTELRAADIAGRARAFGTLVKNGMDMTQAAAVSGVLMEEEVIPGAIGAPSGRRPGPGRPPEPGTEEDPRDQQV